MTFAVCRFKGRQFIDQLQGQGQRTLSA
jgi:hypothetical protein